MNNEALSNALRSGMGASLARGLALALREKQSVLAVRFGYAGYDDEDGTAAWCAHSATVLPLSSLCEKWAVVGKRGDPLGMGLVDASQFEDPASLPVEALYWQNGNLPCRGALGFMPHAPAPVALMGVLYLHDGHGHVRAALTDLGVKVLDTIAVG